MSSERYRILSLAYMGQIEQEEAEELLGKLAKKQRRASRMLWTSILLAAIVGAVFGFHLQDKIRNLSLSALQSFDSLWIVRQAHVWLDRLLHLL